MMRCLREGTKTNVNLCVEIQLMLKVNGSLLLHSVFNSVHILFHRLGNIVHKLFSCIYWNVELYCITCSTFHRPRPKSTCRKKAILIYEYIYLKCAMFKSNYDTSMRPYIYGYVFFSLCIQNVKSILFILLIIQDIFTLGPTFFVLICQFCTVLDILYCLY